MPRKKVSMENNRVSRIIRLMAAIRSGRRYTTEQLVEILGTSRRSFFRDVKCLQAAGVLCRYNRKDNHYEIEHRYLISPPNLNYREATELFRLIRRIMNRRSVPFKIAALTAAFKIEGVFPIDIKKYCLGIIHSLNAEDNPPSTGGVRETVFNQLQKAILEKRVARIHLRLPSQKELVLTDLRPYRFVYSDGRWYLIGNSSLHKTIHSFELKQIKKVSLSHECFTENKRFNIHHHLGKLGNNGPDRKK